MGGAITFAWDPKMCTILDPLFGIDLWGFDFSSCGEISSAVLSAFDSWSSNHPRIKFVDVTNECLAMVAVGDANYTNLSDTKACPLAKIWLTTTSDKVSKEDQAVVTTSSYEFNTQFRHTNGRWALGSGNFETRRSVIGFKKDDICWYLDASFCGPINRAKGWLGAANLLLLSRGGIFALWGIVLADIIIVLLDFINRQREVCRREPKKYRGPTKHQIATLEKRAKEGATFEIRLKAKTLLTKAKKEREIADKNTITRLVQSIDEADEWVAMMEKLVKVNWVPWIARLFLLLSPLCFYEMIFRPCFECYDFQAAAAHEIGHVLGLAHPDTAAKEGRNFMVSRPAGEEYVLDATRRLISAVAASSGETVLNAQDFGYVSEDPTETQDGIDGVEACGGFGQCLLSSKIDCWDPWKRVIVRPNVTAGKTPAVAPSIMSTFSFNNPSACIFQDDLDALNVLYPTCDSTQTYPVCNKPTTYLGFMRLTAYAGLPMVVTLLAMVIFHNLAVFAHKRSQRNSLNDLKKVVEDPNAEIRNPDGTIMSKAEGKAKLLELHLKTLQTARKEQLSKGKRLASREVGAVDNQMSKVALRLTQLKNRGNKSPTKEEQELDKQLLAEISTPAKKLGNKIAWAAKVNRAGGSKSFVGLVEMSKNSRVYAVAEDASESNPAAAAFRQPRRLGMDFEKEAAAAAPAPSASATADIEAGTQVADASAPTAGADGAGLGLDTKTTDAVAP